MPIYEYKCLGCGARVEKMQKVSDAPLQICEVCGGQLEKQVSLSGFQFKGAGWYVTDYAKKSGAAGADSSAKAEKGEKTDKSETGEKSSATESTAKPETASNTSNDAKPAAQTETVSKKE